MVGGGAAWLGYLWWGWQDMPTPADNAATVGSAVRQELSWALAALGLMAYTLWHILRSKTTLDRTALRQTWLWDKELPLRDLAYVRLIRIPGLDWLIAPRLYARTLLGKFAVFYAADPHLLNEFARLRGELKTFRRGM
ncbi:MAG: hypothetical protein RJA34_2381 [Pseudomonadota bacterium]|jgi:hypothetical protein